MGKQINNAEYMTVGEAAVYLRLSVHTIYQKTSREQIPHYKAGGQVLFKRQELDAWVEEGKIRVRQSL